ncbi:MAG: hypothetical protein ACREWG_08685 [Gammaproteobacteria bacterium]
MTGNARNEPPRWLWQWFPPLLLIVQYGVRIWMPGDYTRLFDNELGIVELATPAVLVPGIIAGFAALRYREQLPDRRLIAWIALVTGACVYFAGEELSWGQHLIGWATPDYINKINDQGETNIHNISSWFDQKPRLALELGVMAGGLFYPLYWGRKHPRPSSDWRYWLWPTHVCVPAALLATLIRIPDRLEDWFGIGPLPYAIRYSEPQEYYFAVFLSVYLLTIWLRLRELQRGAPG